MFFISLGGAPASGFEYISGFSGLAWSFWRVSSVLVKRACSASFELVTFYRLGLVQDFWRSALVLKYKMCNASSGCITFSAGARQWFNKVLSIFVPCDIGAFGFIAWVGSGSVFLAGWFGSCFSNVQRQLKVHHLLGFLLRVLVWLLCLSQQVPVKKFSVSREWSCFGFGASRKSAVAMALNNKFQQTAFGGGPSR